MYNIFAASDASGITAERVLQAALTQYDASQVTITRLGGIRTPAQVREVVEQAAQAEGFVVHTFVTEELRVAILQEGRANNVSTVDLMGPLLARLSELLAEPPRAEPGLFNPFDPSYMQRIEAIDYTVRHDDGRNFHDLDRAEIVLVGVSRTSKTPLSIYLAYRGWKVANVPIVLGVNPPKELFDLPRRRVVGLVVRPERLGELRKARTARMGIPAMGYADLDHIRAEVIYAYEVFERRKDWPLVDVTTKPIEEAAAEVVALLGHKDVHSEGWI
jgi:[pyruvate, water dikinase]-phosphate phosphotransferase / [pyruvate, water dikinase] kinase